MTGLLLLSGLIFVARASEMILATESGLIKQQACGANSDCDATTQCCVNGSCQISSICLSGLKPVGDRCDFSYECVSKCCISGSTGTACHAPENCIKACDSGRECSTFKALPNSPQAFGTHVCCLFNRCF